MKGRKGWRFASTSMWGGKGADRGLGCWETERKKIGKKKRNETGTKKARSRRGPEH